ncbi:hypothetical protein ACIRQQ_48040 [Streptomyces fuscichromogenes]|uniref:hypothetical protein n=1 Tax=Streptomyces fuscichromogenes TaxID=1324013 RepID=UPI003830E973
MRAQESRISVALVDSMFHYPHEVWDLGLDSLDMFTEEVIDELDAIRWAEEKERPLHGTVVARTGKHNWGAEGSFSEIIMQVSWNAIGGVGAVAVTAAIKTVYGKLKSRAHADVWHSMPSQDQAIEIARSRLHQHYDVAVDRLTVVHSAVDAEAQRQEFEFRHEDGRKFGATVGALAGMPSCTRVWVDGDPLPRPVPEPPDPGN